MKKGGGGFGQNLVEDHRWGFTAESPPARRHLIEHRAEAEEVGASIELLAPRLLRRHVGHRPHRQAGAGEHFFGGRGREVRNSRLFGGVVRMLGQPEVQYFGLAALGYEDVGGLDVPMDDPLRVGRV